MEFKTLITKASNGNFILGEIVHFFQSISNKRVTKHTQLKDVNWHPILGVMQDKHSLAQAGTMISSKTWIKHQSYFLSS